MNTRDMTRRDVIRESGLGVAGLALLSPRWLGAMFPNSPDEEVIPWLDQPPENPIPDVVANMLKWEEADSWITPNDKFFSVAHYNRPVIDEQDWRLEITGRVRRPLTLSLTQLRARSRQEATFTLECAGNHGFPWFLGGIGNGRWAGTPLAPLLREAGVLDDGIEVVFFGADAGQEEVRGIAMKQNFARSMSLEDAMSPLNLLAYEMNGVPLPRPNGFPLRLIAPGWYGVANVKWLERIEVRSTRFMGRFMARDYVTIREEQRDGETVWAETSVGRSLLKSVPGRVTRDGRIYRIRGAAWGAPIQRVEVRIDNGPWTPAEIDENTGSEFTWKFWSLTWDRPSRGEHTITSRAIDTRGNIQPAMEDPRIAGKHTYWESNGQVTRRVRIS